MNPLIELSLPEEKTIKKGQRLTSKTWSLKLCSMAVAWLDPVRNDVDLSVLEALGRRAVQRLLSQGFFHLFPFNYRGGHVSLCFPQSPQILYAELIGILPRV